MTPEFVRLWNYKKEEKTTLQLPINPVQKYIRNDDEAEN